MLKKAVTKEGTQLMKIEGTGEVFLADLAQDVHLIQLENDSLIGRGSGETFQIAFSGNGWVLIQPSEGPVAGMASASGGGAKEGGQGGVLGGLLGR